MDQLEGEQFFRALADEAPQLMWLADQDGYIYWYNRYWYNYTGTRQEDMVGWGWQSVHDPDKLSQVLDHWKISIETGRPFEMAFPLRAASGEFRMFLTRANPLKDREGRVIRWFGSNTDIEAQAQAERQLQLVVYELNHRVKNMLAMVQAIARQTLRTSSEAELQNFTSRLAALAGAHDLLARQNWQPTTLRDVISQSLQAFGSRLAALTVEGPDVRLSSDRAANWAMAIHELATNAVKYGAWSTNSGQVNICWRLEEGQLRFSWRETGGPEVVSTGKAGFGSRLIRTVGSELGGTSAISYEPEGLLCELNLPADRVLIK